MKILISTPLYPPDIGGPAQYVKNLETIWRQQGHQVAVVYFGKFLSWPTGLRHLIYFFSLLTKVSQADFVLALDTFSVGWPATVAARLLGKKIVIRTGGDFLWEWYVERTGDFVLLRNFYRTRLTKLNLREKIIFHCSRWTVRHCHKLVFSTDWQRQIWLAPYELNLAKTSIIENYYGIKDLVLLQSTKNFLWAGRYLKLKNLEKLKLAFAVVKESHPNLSLDIGQWSPEKLITKIKTSYAVIIPSLSEISPNLILLALQYRKPFILTMETGLYDQLQEVAVFVDPINIGDMASKIIWLANEQNYLIQQKKVAGFLFTHSWSEIASEFSELFHHL